MKISWTWINFCSVQFSHSVVSDCLQPPWTAEHQASLSITNSRSLLKLMPIESVMPSNHLILCHPLLLLPSIFPSFKVFSNESVLSIRWPKYWGFSFNISPSNEYSGQMALRGDVTNWWSELAINASFWGYPNPTKKAYLASLKNRVLLSHLQKSIWQGHRMASLHIYFINQKIKQKTKIWLNTVCCRPSKGTEWLLWRMARLDT